MPAIRKILFGAGTAIVVIVAAFSLYLWFGFAELFAATTE
jgi:hypothetical protein